MHTAVRMSLYGLALAVVFGGTLVAGRVVGPLQAAPAVEAHSAGGDGHGGGHEAAAGAAALPGLAAEADGFSLVPDGGVWAAGVEGVYRFRITDREARVVTDFAVEHEKRLHLVVVRRDGAHFRHVHPELAADGTWSVPLVLPAAGEYRVYADFRPEGGNGLTLAADLRVAGEYAPAGAVAGEVRTAVVDGYLVTAEGKLTAGTASELTVRLSAGGAAVTDLQPYLGAYGHLVALRASDLAYLHVHPEGTPGDGVTAAGPTVGFAVEVPSAGRYLLYLDFRHGDVVRTAAFVLDATGTGTAAGGHGDDGHGHGG